MARTIIRGGTVVDGTGAAARTADVAIEDGLVVEVGRADSAGATVVDADGLVVAPGWVDVHTHYDGQVFWDPLMTPSSWHGATTVVMGNCGVGFAPVKPTARDAVIDLMMRIEDIPTDTLRAGMPWTWESFGEYLDELDATPLAIDVGALVPHGTVRTYVMEERAERGEPTPDELSTITSIIAGALRAGAIGCSTNRTLAKGAVVPGSFAATDELLAVARVVGEQGGVLQTSPAAFIGRADADWTTEEFEADLLRDQAVTGGCPVTFPVVQDHEDPDRWRRIMARVDAANAAGAQLVPQVLGRPLNAVFGLDAHHPFERVPVYQELMAGARTLADKVARLSDPTVRQQVTGQARELLGQAAIFRNLYRIEFPLDYEPDPQRSISSEAARAQLSPVEVFYDKLLEDGGTSTFLMIAANYAAGNGDVVYEMIQHPATILGLGDGGAHCLSLTDATTPTTVLTHWVRDRHRGPRLPIERAVHELSLHPARRFGLYDRGALLPGLRADVNLVDLEHLAMGPLEYLHDLPAGNRRLVQRASGYVATFVAGEQIYADGEDTGARPGRTVRPR